MVPPNAIEPVAKTLVSIVSRAVLFNVVGTVPATVKEFAAMLVTAVPIERPPPPEPMVKAPNLVAPTLPERVTDPEAFAVKVNG